MAFLWKRTVVSILDLTLSDGESIKTITQGHIFESQGQTLMLSFNVS